MSQFAEKLREAGFGLSSERLRDIAIDAFARNPRNWDGARNAIYAAVSHDAALLWELFAPYRGAAVHRLLTDVAQQLRQQEKAGDLVVKTEPRPGAGRSNAETQDAIARASQSAAAAAVAKVVTLSLLDTFKINGCPIGKCTPREALGWASSRERDARFVRLLTANLPLDQPIGRYRTDLAEVQRTYDQADAERQKNVE